MTFDFAHVSHLPSDSYLTEHPSDRSCVTPGKELNPQQLALEASILKDELMTHNFKLKYKP